MSLPAATDAPETITDAPACLACGTCCFSNLDRYVPVSGDDHARLGDDAERFVTWIGNRAFLRMEGGHCAALAVDEARALFVCTVYESRPTTCRTLGRGSPECAGERETKGERPLAALATLRRARAYGG